MNRARLKLKVRRFAKKYVAEIFLIFSFTALYIGAFGMAILFGG